MNTYRLSLLLILLTLALGSCQRRTSWEGDSGELFTQIYRIPPGPAYEGTAEDPFAGLASLPTAEEKLRQRGVTFPEGAAIITGLSLSGFGMRNTMENHHRVEAILTEDFGPDGWSIATD